MTSVQSNSSLCRQKPFLMGATLKIYEYTFMLLPHFYKRESQFVNSFLFCLMTYPFRTALAEIKYSQLSLSRLISNNRVFRRENLVLVLHRYLKSGYKILWEREIAPSTLFHNIINIIFLTKGVKLHSHL